MRKSTIDLPVQSPGQNLSHAQNPLVTVTPEPASATHQEKEVCLGVFIEGIVDDCDEDGGEGSDPPTRLFLRR
ncbi:hypothetical protein ACFX11_012815 [Malus domestica]